MPETDNLTNYEKWRLYTDGLISPDSFIDFGFYFLIGAALQRRVWVGPKHMQLFPNQYTTFVSDPGIGKGLVIRAISHMLRHHKLSSPNEKTHTVTGTKTGDVEPVNRELIEAAAKADYESGINEEQRGSEVGKKYNNYEKPLLFPVAADSTSFEALVTSMSRALRRKNYVEFDEQLQRNVTKIYTHSSMSFCLEEISSLFRKRAEDVANFLQITYDCGDFKKDTKTQGTDRIQKCCLSFLGGTQPNFMRRSFSDGLLNEGFASRTWFIFESRNRKTTMHIPELTPLQKMCEIDILNHLLKLSNLYGGCTYTPEAYSWLEQWWIEAQTERVNLSERLLHYYSRKNIHIQKLAMALHFSEKLDFVITLEECKRALAILDKAEAKMHHAIITKSENPYFGIGQKILGFLTENGSRTRNELFAKFYEELPSNDPKDALEKILDYHMVMGKINSITQNGKTRYETIKKKEHEEVNGA